jgi:thymidylate synthase
MIQYIELLQQVLSEGEYHQDRTGTGRCSIFGVQKRYDLNNGATFPLVTIRKSFFASAVKEILWMLRGERNVKTLGAGFWNPWAREGGDIGPLYGHQLRHWPDGTEGGNDQIANVLESLRQNPKSRRHIITTFNPLDAPKGVLYPCHGIVIQFYPSADGQFLDLHMVQRSQDLILGYPVNVAEYALLLMIFANRLGRKARTLIHTISDCHLYSNHIEGVKEMLSREPLKLPRVTIADKPMPYPGCARDGSVLEPEDVQLIGYEHHGRIKFPIAV